MKMRISDRTLSVVLAGFVAALASACGDDGGGGGDGANDSGLSADGGGTTNADDQPSDDEDDGPTTDDEDDGPTTDDEDDGPTTADDTDDADDGPTADDTDDGPGPTEDGGTDDAPTDDDGPVTTEDGGTTSTPTSEDGGNTEPTPATGDIDELISAICQWQFRCCDVGEINYRLGPDRADEESCIDLFTYELHQSNSQKNDFAGRPGLELLGTLAFNVDLERVEIDPEGVAECTAQWQEQDCNQAYEPVAHCGGPVDYTGGACSLSNLFKPTLQEDDECTVALTETAAGNDIECLPGTTCLAAGDPENPNNDSACVSRAVDGEPCTEDTDCDFNYYCGPGGECAEKGSEGDPCSFDDPELPAPGAEDAACKLGLSCHPLDLVCVNNCSEGYTCYADSECPDGFSCAPLTVGDDSTSFHVCRELGSTGTARCDDDVDCVENRYCGGGICSADADENEECGADGQCPDGTYCNDTTLVCAPYTLRGNACVRLDGTFASEECEPAAVGCIYDEGDAALKCSSSKNDLGEGCLADYDCESGMCEYATSEATAMTCVGGADVEDDCDEDVATGDALRCMPGAVCFEGACRAQLPAGGDCEDSSAADSSLCANSDCVQTWDDAFMCTDQPIPESVGGTGLTCDGN